MTIEPQLLTRILSASGLAGSPVLDVFTMEDGIVRLYIPGCNEPIDVDPSTVLGAVTDDPPVGAGPDPVTDHPPVGAGPDLVTDDPPVGAPVGAGLRPAPTRSPHAKRNTKDAKHEGHETRRTRNRRSAASLTADS